MHDGRPAGIGAASHHRTDHQEQHVTFEYRDRDGDAFTARPTIGTPKPAILLHISPSNSAHVPLDHVEEVVAGIRDAARQAAGQTTTTEQPCGSRSLPTYSGEIVHCVLAAGHAKRCQSATEYPYVSWPNPSVRAWNPEPEPVVEQPAEPQPAEEARPPRVEWRIELLDVDGWMPSGLVRPDRELAAQYLAGRRKQRPDATFRLVRETTTWTVEEQP